MYNATFKVIIFGDRSSGRTIFTERFLGTMSDESMTIGVEFYTKSVTFDGLKIKLQIWDFRGEERFRFLLPTYVRQARGGLFLYDITNYLSIKHIDDWLSIIRKELKPEDIFPIMAVGIIPDEEYERQVSHEEGIKIAKSRKLNGFIECNPKTGENVEKTFEALARLMLWRIKKEAIVQKKDGESIITYTIHLEKRLRNLEAENLRLEEQIRLEKQKNQLELKQDLNNLQNKIDKYKTNGC